MPEQLLSNNGLPKEKLTDNLPLSEKLDAVKKTMTVSSIYVDSETFKNFLLLQRRALLQSVAADERLINEMDMIVHQIEMLLVPSQITVKITDSGGAQKTQSIEVNDMVINHALLLEIVKKCIVAVKKNTHERRKAYLQIIRDTERRYNMNTGKKKNRFAK